MPFITLEKIKSRYKDKTALIKELQDKDQKIFQLEITNNQIKEVQYRNKELGLLWDSTLNESVDYLLAKKIQKNVISKRHAVPDRRFFLNEKRIKLKKEWV